MPPIARLIAATTILGAAFTAVPAQAIEVNCVEASRYKHIMRIFGNDNARFAAFFRTSTSQMPHPESCRALIVTGRVNRFERGQENEDFAKLAQALANGRGWVTTLYLASPGGNIATGLRLGELTRMFWLNTHAVDGPNVEYVPDFLGSAGPGSAPNIPPELEAGYRDYKSATQTIAALSSQDRRARRCVSACTFIHSAGIYRHGEAHFHRGRPGAGREEEDQPSMADLVTRLQNGEARVLAFYRKMDAGDAAISAFQNTATETTTKAGVLMMPRYVGDYLKKECARAGRRPGETMSRDDERRAAKREFPEGFADVQCIASSHSRERLLQFAKLCSNGCDARDLYREASKRVSSLVPRENSNNPRSAQSPQDRYDQPQRPLTPYPSRPYPSR